jgi:thioredoxin 1
MIPGKAILTLAGVLAVTAGASWFMFREVPDPALPRAAPPGAVEIAAGDVVRLTSRNFADVQAAGKPVLVDFWAPWCGPCRTQGPIVEQVAAQMGDSAIVGKVNVDEERDLARQFGVRAIPTLIVFKAGAPMTQFVGVHPVADLTAALAKAQ